LYLRKILCNILKMANSLQEITLDNLDPESVMDHMKLSLTEQMYVSVIWHAVL